MSSPLRLASSPKIPPRATILFADDDPDTCEMMKILLAFDGFEVVIARDGLSALELARQTVPKLILIDLELPKLNGLGVVKSLKRDRRFKEIPIVMISGHSPTRFGQAALDAGCEEYLFKPFDFGHLHELLDSVKPAVFAKPARRRHAAA